MTRQGDGNGAWVASSVDGGTSRTCSRSSHPGWSEGLAWCGERVAIALTDGERTGCTSDRAEGRGA